MDVGLHHHRQQRPVDPAAGLQQGGEEGALAQLGDLELDIARLGRQQPRPRAVAVGGTASAALIAAGADPLGSLGLDQRLQHQGEALADDVEVTAGTQRIQQISNGRLVQGHRGELLGVNLGGNTLSFTRWPLALLVSRARACPQSPPLPGTLTQRSWGIPGLRCHGIPVTAGWVCACGRGGYGRSRTCAGSRRLTLSTPRSCMVRVISLVRMSTARWTPRSPPAISP